MKIGVAGSIESNDCLVTIKKADDMQGIKIEIQSIVYDFFKDEIEKVIRKTLSEENLDNVVVTIQDKGALNYTIKARLLTAIGRMK